MTKFNFDKWALGFHWPQNAATLPLFGKVNVIAEDIKFAFNCWCLLRLCSFYGVGHPTVLSPLQNVTPSMDPSFRGNFIFHKHCIVNAGMGRLANSKNLKLVLTPNHPRALPLHQVDIPAQLLEKGRALGLPTVLDRDTGDSAASGGGLPAIGIDLVVGQENGLTKKAIDQCDQCIYLPQHGSIGSLSMLNALGIALHTLHCEFRSSNESFHAQSRQFFDMQFGKMPETETAEVQQENKSAKDRPHSDDLIGLTNDSLMEHLKTLREEYPLQLKLVWENNIADRNIGASIRNANVYNCEKVVIVGRKKFSRRGTVGCHLNTDVVFVDDVESEAAARELEGYSVWMLHQYYPHHSNHFVRERDVERGYERAKKMTHSVQRLRYKDEDLAPSPPPRKGDSRLASSDVSTLPVEEQDLLDCSRIPAEKLGSYKAFHKAIAKQINTRHCRLWMPPEHDLYLPVVEEACEQWCKDHSLSSPNHPMYAALLASRAGEETKGSSSSSMLLDLAEKNPLIDEKSTVDTAVEKGKKQGIGVVYLDSLESIVQNIEEVLSANDQQNGEKWKKGIAIVVNEEGCTPTWKMLQRADKVMYLVAPEKVVSAEVQRGIPGAISSAIVMERLRFGIAAVTHLRRGRTDEAGKESNSG